MIRRVWLRDVARSMLSLLLFPAVLVLILRPGSADGVAVREIPLVMLFYDLAMSFLLAQGNARLRVQTSLAFGRTRAETLASLLACQAALVGCACLYALAAMLLTGLRPFSMVLPFLAPMAAMSVLGMFTGILPYAVGWGNVVSMIFMMIVSGGMGAAIGLSAAGGLFGWSNLVHFLEYPAVWPVCLTVAVALVPLLRRFLNTLRVAL